MNRQGNDEKKTMKIVAGLTIRIGLIGCLLIAIVAWRLSTLAWFSENKNVNASGMSVSSKASPQLIIDNVYRATPVDMGDSDRLTITPPENTKIAPGSNGSFTMWISNCTDDYNILLNCRTQCVTEADGAVPESISDISDIENINTSVPEYVKTHMAFFLGKNGDTYSDWINPETGIEIDWSTAQNGQVEVTVYWVWIESYSALNQNFPDEIKNSMKSDISFKKWLSTDITAWNGISNNSAALSTAYDDADWEIGMALNNKKICFTVDVSPVKANG